MESCSGEAVCYFAWDDQDSIQSKMLKAPHYQVKRHSTGFALYTCDDDQGMNAKQIVGNARDIIGKPTMDPKKRKGCLQEYFGYVAPNPPHRPGATQWYCSSCKEIFEGPNTCRSASPEMNCRKHCEERHFVKTGISGAVGSHGMASKGGGQYEIWYHVDGGKSSVFGDWYARVDRLN